MGNATHGDVLHVIMSISESHSSAATAQVLSWHSFSIMKPGNEAFWRVTATGDAPEKLDAIG